MLTTPFDIVKWRLHLWFHDYHHRAQAHEKQIKRWRKLKARLADELAKEDIYELTGWSYRKVNRPVENNQVWKRVFHHACIINTEHYVFHDVTPVRAIGSRLTDVRLSGPGGSVVFGRRTRQEQRRK